ncbi:hypothetical protein HanHA300_Chr02g0038441 [Helianthus annuus]|nr:hypothetical protein HanHA300_Chr02g0038441 [Helianthus annuus]KAJ0617368.1 hypothetical protein HanHA89_Chr02g0041091 [Helianthus annuus]
MESSYHENEYKYHMKFGMIMMNTKHNFRSSSSDLHRVKEKMFEDCCFRERTRTG